MRTPRTHSGVAKERATESLPAFIPQHARGWTAAQMPMSARLANVLSKLNVRLLGDLHGIAFDDLLKVKNCGRHTITELVNLLDRLQTGEFDKASTEVSAVTPAARLSCLIDEFVIGLSSRDRDVLLLRHGGAGDEPMTLEEVGARYGLTRERVRQILMAIIKRLRASTGPQIPNLSRAIADLCRAEVCPLTPALLALWTEGRNSHCLYPSEFYLRLFNEINADIPVWIDADKPSGQMKPRARQIAQIIKERLNDERAAVSFRELFDDLRADVERQKLTVGEFLAALWGDHSLTIYFSATDRPTVLFAKRRRREWVRQILSQSDAPLTPEAIIARAVKMFGENFLPPSPFSLANSLKPEDGFYLLEPRAFGLREHMRLPEADRHRACQDIYELMRGVNRPVSTTQVINEAQFAWTALTNAYETAQILREDERFVDLGRFLFALTDWGVAEREHVSDIIFKVLEQAGRPMTTSEIIEAAQRSRSLSPTSMPLALRENEAVQSYGFAYYGLKSWGEPARHELLAKSHFVNRVIARSEPPLTFARLCEILHVAVEGDMADRVWRVVRSLGKVRAVPDRQSPETLLIHKNWSLEKALRAVLAEARRPLPPYEAQWGLAARYKATFDDRTLADVERCLARGAIFVRDTRGEYLLDEDLALDELDAVNIRQTCLEILTETNEVVGADRLLERLTVEGVAGDTVSPDMLAALLRDDDAFEEIGRNRFRAKV